MTIQYDIRHGFKGSTTVQLIIDLYVDYLEILVVPYRAVKLV